MHIFFYILDHQQCTVVEIAILNKYATCGNYVLYLYFIFQVDKQVISNSREVPCNPGRCSNTRRATGCKETCSELTTSPTRTLVRIFCRHRCNWPQLLLSIDPQTYPPRIWKMWRTNRSVNRVDDPNNWKVPAVSKSYHLCSQQVININKSSVFE